MAEKSRFDAFTEASMTEKGHILHRGPEHDDHSGEEEVADATAKKVYHQTTKQGREKVSKLPLSTGIREEQIDNSLWGSDPAEIYELRQRLAEEEIGGRVIQKGRGGEIGEIEDDVYISDDEKTSKAEELEGQLDERTGRLAEKDKDRREKRSKFKNAQLGRATKLGRSQGKPGTGDRPRQVPKYKTEPTHIREEQKAA